MSHLTNLTSNPLRALRGRVSAAAAAALLSLCIIPVAGQKPIIPQPTVNRPDLLPPAERGEQDGQNQSYLEEEMRAKREIQAVDKAHKENVRRARDLASLTASLLNAFERNNHLNRDDFKSLEKVEKLARNIRESAGGSDLDVEMDDKPTNLHAALSKLNEVSDSLKKRVEKTPKRVVSAAIIEEANVLLELIDIVRSMHPKA